MRKYSRRQFMVLGTGMGMGLSEPCCRSPPSALC